MSIRRGWETLTEKYRSRLVKGGISKAQYERGESLKKARGHSKTPENAAEFEREQKKNPVNPRFKEYRERRKGLIERVQRKKVDAFQYTLRWNEEHSDEYVRKGGPKEAEPKVTPPKLADLRKIDGMTVEELVNWQYDHKFEDDWRFLWYH
jgi:hypothetical protein